MSSLSYAERTWRMCAGVKLGTGSRIAPFLSIIIRPAVSGALESAGISGKGSIESGVATGSAGTCCATCSED